MAAEKAALAREAERVAAEKAALATEAERVRDCRARVVEQTGGLDQIRARDPAIAGSLFSCKSGIQDAFYAGTVPVISRPLPARGRRPES